MLFTSQSTHLGLQVVRGEWAKTNRVAITGSRSDVSFFLLCWESILKWFTKRSICSFSHILSTSAFSITLRRNRKMTILSVYSPSCHSSKPIFFLCFVDRDRQDVHAALFHTKTVNGDQASKMKKKKKHHEIKTPVHTLLKFFFSKACLSNNSTEELL